MRTRNRIMNTIARIGTVVLIAVMLTPARAAAQAGIVEQVGSVMTEAGPVTIENVAGGLEHPWGMAFLPDGRLLVTERTGDLRILNVENGSLSQPLAGIPTVFAQGQGGLLDVALDPNFKSNQRVYLSYARPGPGDSAATVLGRGRLVPQGSAARDKADSDSLAGFEVLFTQEPWISGPNHFGGRIEFTPEGTLFLTLGERFQFDPAQDLSNHLGTIVHLNPDGSVPTDNPFVDQADARGEIWTYGHRNIEAAALHPETDSLWIAEMAPLGGDELNRPAAGRNYGWPVVSWGMNYDGTDIPDPPTQPKFADAVRHWSPVISPSGMAFYTGDAFPEWRGSALIGSLTRHGLVRLVIEKGAVTSERVIPLGARIRDVEQGPDGHVYVLIDRDDGNVWRLTPLQ